MFHMIFRIMAFIKQALVKELKVHVTDEPGKVGGECRLRKVEQQFRHCHGNRDPKHVGLVVVGL